MKFNKYTHTHVHNSLYIYYIYLWSSHTYSKGKDQPGYVANLACGQLNRENEYFPVPVRTPENLVSRDRFGSPVPRQPAHLHTQAESGAYLRDSSRVPRRRPFIDLNRHTPWGQFRVYRVITQLRTDGVHCRESACTGPAVLKVVPVTGAAFYGFTMNRIICVSLFPRTHYEYLLMVWSGHVESTV